MILLLVIAGGTGMPEKNVVLIGEAIIEFLIVPFVGIGRVVASNVGTGAGGMTLGGGGLVLEPHPSPWTTMAM